MPNAATRAKARWNAANYVQIRASVRPGIADAFKAACAAADVSMAGELSRLMTEFAAVGANRTPVKKTAANPVSTKKKRSNMVSELIHKLEQVRDAEEQAMENTPENLRGSVNFEASEERVSLMNEALDILERLY